MGFDIAGATITGSGSNVAINSGVNITSASYVVPTVVPGYSGGKSSSGTYGYTTNCYSVATTGWPINYAYWNSGALSTGPSNIGVFTCPIAGLYAIGFNGIANGGSGIPAAHNTYGYAGFAKNGSLSYWIHWNLSSTNGWNQGGGSQVFSCAASDTLSLFINMAPAPVSEVGTTYNYGFYPDLHHHVWCVQIG